MQERLSLFRRCALLVGLVCALMCGARACSCAVPSTLEEATEYYLHEAAEGKVAVFAGEAISVRPISSRDSSFVEKYDVTLRVSQFWKGKPRRFLTLQTEEYQYGCGYPFKTGQEYLVYAVEGSGDTTTSACSPTKSLADAKADLQILGPPIYAPNPLPLFLTAIGATLALGGFYWHRKRS